MNVRERELRDMRNRFYPGWWIHRSQTQDPLKPLYVVVCDQRDFVCVVFVNLG